MIDNKQKAKYILEEYANCYSQVDLEELAKYLDKIKAEAYKEFGENLEKAFSKTECQMPNSEVIKQTVQICRNTIRLVLKELVGEDNAEEEE